MRYTAKKGTIAKKGLNTKTTSWEVIAQVVLITMNMAIILLAPRVGYFAHGRFHVKGPRKKVNVERWIFLMKCER